MNKYSEWCRLLIWLDYQEMLAKTHFDEKYGKWCEREREKLLNEQRPMGVGIKAWKDWKREHHECDDWEK